MSRYLGGANVPRGSRLKASLGAGSVRFTQRIEIDRGKALSIISSLASGFIRKRTASGKDIHGNPFASYSSSYKARMAEGGEDPNRVDLTVTGGLIASINERSRSVHGNGGSVIIGPDTGTSPAVAFLKGRAKRTGKRGPAHNILGAWLHFGTPKMPARPFLGLTQKERQKISKALTRASAKVLKEKRGR